MVAHYGVPAPKVMADAGPQSAGACVGHLLAALRRHSGAALKLVLGDMNTQRRSSRIDVGGATSPDAAEQLLVKTQTEAGLVDPIEAVRGSCAVSASVLLSSSGDLGGHLIQQCHAFHQALSYQPNAAQQHGVQPTKHSSLLGG